MLLCIGHTSFDLICLIIFNFFCVGVTLLDLDIGALLLIPELLQFDGELANKVGKLNSFFQKFLKLYVS